MKAYRLAAIPFAFVLSFFAANYLLAQNPPAPPNPPTPVIGGSIIPGTTPVSGSNLGCVLYNASTGLVGCDTGFTYAPGTGAIFSNLGGTPAVAAGQLMIGGLLATPTFSANGAGADYVSTVNGYVVAGQGSTNDFAILNKNGLTSCNVPTATTNLTCGTMTANSFTPKASPLSGNSLYLPSANTVGISANSILVQSWTSTETILAFPLRFKGYTVGTLPAGNQGDYAFVSDQLTVCAAAGAALTGGGAVVCPVFFNGTAWVGG